MPHHHDHRHGVRCLPAARAAAVLAAIAALLLSAGTVPADAVPSTVLPAPDAAGGEVSIEPAVLRAPEGHAEVDVVLGVRAPGDVVVELSAATPAVARDGTVTVGTAAPDVAVSEGARLRPGERLRVRVVAGADPVLVIAHVHPATAGPTGAEPPTGSSADAGDPPVDLATLVLPGAPGPAPQAEIEVTEGQVVATVATSAPVLVTARLAGARATTYPDRLVLPSQPLVLEAAPARWPSPSVLTVTDETGRTVRADTGRAPLIVVAAGLLTAALAGAAIAARAHRRRRSSRTPGGAATPGTATPGTDPSGTDPPGAASAPAEDP